MKRVLTLTLALLVTACSQEEQKPAVAPKSEVQVAKKESVVVVPEKVKGKWKAVVIKVNDKVAGKEALYTVAIGSTFSIPNSNLAIRVENFLPHFMMEGTTLTSQSNEPKNPAAQVRVMENGKEVFKGWLFTLYPTTHAFQHPRYGFALEDFVPSG